MSRAFHTYTPRIRPLVYDALKVDVGCQDIEGRKYYASQPFTEICLATHDVDPDAAINKPDIVSYARGPAATGGDFPWVAIWAAWVSDTGIRIAKQAHVTPPANGVGNPSSLFPTGTKPTALSLGFTALGQVGIAIQKDETHIEVRWFRDGSGSAEMVGGSIFLGRSPVLFSNILVLSGSTPEVSDLVLYYLRPEFPRTLFARFERDYFNVERVVHTTLPVAMKKLVYTEGVDGVHTLYGRDEFDRDVTLETDKYSTPTTGDDIAEETANEISLDVVIYSGAYEEHGLLAVPEMDAMTLGVEIVSGAYTEVAQPAALSAEEISLSIAIVSGQYD